MGFNLSKQSMNHVIEQWKKEYIIYAPKRVINGGAFSDTDIIRYGEISSIEDVIYDKKSDYSFKEILLPISETLFYFTEDSVKEADGPKKGAIVFLRSCDLHAVKRLDEIYLQNGSKDYYYNRIREKLKFVLIGCENNFEDCFCVDMGTNESNNYDAYIQVQGDEVLIDNKNESWNKLFENNKEKEMEVSPAYVLENDVSVNIPENITMDIAKSSIWEEYNTRCINCGRCNFVCPTCSCFTMQDIFYKDNGKAGERRRVWASCMVDSYTDVAGGGSYRKKSGERMRFKVMHKVYDFKKRFGYHMCVGCGRCDHVCPEYISFSGCINKLEAGMKEVMADGK